MQVKIFFVYILTNWNNKVMYVGVTNNLIRRVYEHRQGIGSEFTRKYNVHKLVYYESFGNALMAIKREKEIKGWKREKKNALVSQMNPEWKDLYGGLVQEEPD
jgi:putative endonuclease